MSPRQSISEYYKENFSVNFIGGEKMAPNCGSPHILKICGFCVFTNSLGDDFQGNSFPRSLPFFLLEKVLN